MFCDFVLVGIGILFEIVRKPLPVYFCGITTFDLMCQRTCLFIEPQPTAQRFVADAVCTADLACIFALPVIFDCFLPEFYRVGHFFLPVRGGIKLGILILIHYKTKFLRN